MTIKRYKQFCDTIASEEGDLRDWKDVDPLILENYKLHRELETLRTATPLTYLVLDEWGQLEFEGAEEEARKVFDQAKAHGRRVTLYRVTGREKSRRGIRKKRLPLVEESAEERRARNNEIFSTADGAQLRIVEGVAGTWFYHLRVQGSHAALCGRGDVMSTPLPDLRTWGFVGHLGERYCPECARKGGLG